MSSPLGSPSSSKEVAAAEKLCTGLTDTMHTLSNEPSLGLYYVVEHIQRSVPSLVSNKRALAQCGTQLQGADLDAGFALESLQSATSPSTRASLSSVSQLAAAAAARARS